MPFSFVPVLMTKPLFPLSFPTRKVSRTIRGQHRPVCVADSVDEAIHKGFVKDFGRVVHLDHDGYFPLMNDLRISEPLRQPLDDVVNVIRHVIGRGEVRAVFLRGSVATGNYLKNGMSDLDLIVIVNSQISLSRRLKVHSYVSFAIKESLILSGPDIYYIHSKAQSLRKDRYGMTADSNVLLRNYAIPLYTADTNFLMEARYRPTGNGALNIRKHERSFLRLFEKGSKTGDFPMQRDSIKWMCKSALRSIADLASLTFKWHSRDLLPCYRLAAFAFPDHERTLLLGLQFACASSDSQYLGLPKSMFLHMGYNVARDMVEVAELLSLHQNFGSKIPFQSDFSSSFSSGLFPTSSWRENISEVLSEAFARIRWYLNPKLNGQNISFLRNALPWIPLECSTVKEVEADRRGSEEVTELPYSLNQNLDKVQAPVVIRKCVRVKRSSIAETVYVLEELAKTTHVVQCRVSPGPEFTFCRASHPWISEQRFFPPSVLTSMSVENAILRMSRGANAPPLKYEGFQERIYIQTKAMRSQQLFTDLKSRGLIVAQEERIWVSTHGSVSGLHFDSTYSALLQRSGEKRMIFFPPECLEHSGIYPLGHPLHRRSRVNLSRPESVVFQDFWKKCSCKATEAILKEGDLIVFPPFWSHYTESISSQRNALSISHTIRFV